jgi:hypothetical protein
MTELDVKMKAAEIISELVFTLHREEISDTFEVRLLVL